MVSERLEEFARVLVEHSAEIQEGDNVYIYVSSLEGLELFEEVRRQVIEKGAYPHEHVLYDSQIGHGAFDRDYMSLGNEEQMKHASDLKLEEMERMDAYIRIGGSRNTQELSKVGSNKISMRKEATEEILNERLDLKWVATRYPTSADAQAAEMSTQEYKDFVFDAVTEIDWEHLEEKNEIIKKVFDEAEEVRIVDQNTDLRLSLEGREGVPDNGECNVPSGEVFYAPRKESLEGHIKFSYPAVDDGNEVKGVRLEFENGKIVDFSAEENEEYLKKMINTDEGSRYIGELGIGTNRQIDRHVKNTLFDEKLGGTIHLAIGRAYEENVEDEEERNDSSIHWDIVKDLRKRKGGGKIIVDGEVVQEDGEWQIEGFKN
jgi:aminopeptidase